MNTNDRQTNRIMELELQLMHLQRDFDALNEVVLQQGRRLDEISGSVQQLNTKLETARSQR